MVSFKKSAFIGSAALALALGSAPARAQDDKAPTDKSEAEWNAQKVEAKRSQIDATAGAALDQLLKGNSSAKELYEKAYGWAAFDNLKLGFFFSGGGGKGVAVAKKSGKRTYMDMGSAGFGLAFGGKKYEVVFLFQDSKWDTFCSSVATLPLDETSAFIRSGRGRNGFGGGVQNSSTGNMLLELAPCLGTR